MTTPLEKIAEEIPGNNQSLLKGGQGVPPIGKRPIYFNLFSFEGFPYLLLYI